MLTYFSNRLPLFMSLFIIPDVFIVLSLLASFRLSRHKVTSKMGSMKNPCNKARPTSRKTVLANAKIA